MDAILKHLLDVTGHRDHQLLEWSILSALKQMADVEYARILSVNVRLGKSAVFPKAWIVAGQIGMHSDQRECDSAEEPLSNYPALEACIAQMTSSVREPLADERVRLWFPIWIDGKVSACFEVHQPTGVLARHSDVIEGMLGVYRNFVALLDYSERDSLTGLLNRKTFEQHFSKRQAEGSKEEIAELPSGTAERRQENEVRQQWLAVVDIDHFKRVNDTFGHLYGDEVLILIAQLMVASFRAQDRIFRFGGEEFVIIIHAATLEHVSAIIERFRHTVEMHRFPQVGQITVSVGFTSFHADESPVETLGHADDALYYAKSHGRNQVQHYDLLVEQGVLPHVSKADVAAIEYF